MNLDFHKKQPIVLDLNFKFRKFLTQRDEKEQQRRLLPFLCSCSIRFLLPLQFRFGANGLVCVPWKPGRIRYGSVLDSFEMWFGFGYIWDGMSLDLWLYDSVWTIVVLELKRRRKKKVNGNSLNVLTVIEFFLFFLGLILEIEFGEGIRVSEKFLRLCQWFLVNDWSSPLLTREQWHL